MNSGEKMADKLWDKGLFGVSCTWRKEEDFIIRGKAHWTNITLLLVAGSHLCPLQLGGLRRSVLELLQVLLLDGLPDPVHVVSS